MANRVYFASQGLAINGTTVQGAQSLGTSVNFTTEQAFQLGRLAIYDNIITDAEVGITASKNLDGKALMLNLFGVDDVGKASNTTATIKIGSSIVETGTILGTGTNQYCTVYTGCYLSSASYTFPVDGWATEELSWVTDNASVESGTKVTPPTDASQENAYRHHIDVSGVGGNIQSVTMSADLGREAMFKLGQFRPYHRFANFPIEVTVEVTTLDTAAGAVITPLTGVTCTGSYGSSFDIGVRVCDMNTDSANPGYTFVCRGCQISSSSSDGGGTDGGNLSTTATYTTYNSLEATGTFA